MNSTQQAQGSIWQRWDPHIHAPGTVLNDQYSGQNPWEQFLTLVENSNPPIRTLGVTDYYSLDCYEAVLERKKQGRLTNVDLIFPNVELRYGIGTGKNHPINFHLLISPEDPDHVEQAKRFLRSLTFEAHGEVFRCDGPELIRLGRACEKQVQDDRAALKTGVNQFKVNHDKFKEEWKRSTWAQKNMLVAVAGGRDDGSSGLQGDASLHTLRQEIERTAHIIFSAEPKQRLFWSGRGPASVEQLNSDYNGRKPCIHGSDAHDFVTVGAPAKERYCWIKGDLSFESLCQICLEPETRVYIGPQAPGGALASQVIGSVSITNVPWLKTPTVLLNSGLVGIIGARGSGKTALADMIAAGASASSPHTNERSFLHRARRYLTDSDVRLSWNDGNIISRALRGENDGEAGDIPSVQYLSQQFVDRLCSADGVTDELLLEIERVVYQAHPLNDRMNTIDFRGLLAIRTAHARTLRQQHQEDLDNVNAQFTSERERRAALPALERQQTDKTASIKNDKAVRRGLASKDNADRLQQYERVSTAAEAIRFKVQQERRRSQALRTLKVEVADTRTNKAPLRLRRLQQENIEAKLTSDEWTAFLTDFTGPVDNIISAAIQSTDDLVVALSGPILPEDDLAADAKPSPVSFLPEEAELEKLPLNLLEREVKRLSKLIGIDTENAKNFARLSKKISTDEAELVKINAAIASAKTASDRINTLRQSRLDSYAAIFDTLIDEEAELTSLYEPLKKRLEAEAGTLGKLSFSMRRLVDADAWAKFGEERLLDLRKAGPFKGKGALLDATKKELCPAWETGSSVQVADAMAAFRDKYERIILEYSPYDKSSAQEFKKWTSDVSTWLYSTDHIRITYGIQYDGVDIEQLSPGTRGIVLLLLYLAIDRDDDRPLIIDQPEENLDPKSIFDELVERFRQTKLRRQIIVVTHNANLIVNTDADQVIVADCDRQQPGELPEITYRSGGLENSEIRRLVCEILEGGEAAFQERAKRLRLRI